MRGDKNIHNWATRLVKASIRLKLSQIDYFKISNWIFFRDYSREFSRGVADHVFFMVTERIPSMDPFMIFLHPSQLSKLPRITSHPLDFKSRLYPLFPRDISFFTRWKIFFAKLKPKGF